MVLFPKSETEIDITTEYLDGIVHFSEQQKRLKSIIAEHNVKFAISSGRFAPWQIDVFSGLSVTVMTVRSDLARENSTRYVTFDD